MAGLGAPGVRLRLADGARQEDKPAAKPRSDTAGAAGRAGAKEF